MTTKTTFLLIAMSLPFFSFSQTQFKIEVKNLYMENPTKYQNLPPDDSTEKNTTGDVIKIKIDAYPANYQVAAIWSKILNCCQHTKYDTLVSNIQVMQTNLDGFYSYVVDSKKIIFYDEKFYEQFLNVKNVDITYLILFSLAHEIGHFANGDVYSLVRSKLVESKADMFACQILCSLNEASSVKIQSVINTLAGAGHDDLYPNKGDRLKDIDAFFSNYPCEADLNGIGIRISDQIWARANLDVETYSNGDLIEKATTIDDWKEFNDKKIGCWCYYNFNPANESKYGRLYNGYVILDRRGVAPKGWHIPNKQDWKGLLPHVRNLTVMPVGVKGSAAFVAFWNHNNNGDIPQDIFEPFMGGFIGSGNEVNLGYHFLGIEKIGAWWSTDKFCAMIGDKPLYYTAKNITEMKINPELESTNDHYNDLGLSIRLVKDK